MSAHLGNKYASKGGKSVSARAYVFSDSAENIVRKLSPVERGKLLQLSPILDLVGSLSEDDFSDLCQVLSTLSADLTASSDSDSFETASNLIRELSLLLHILK